LTSLSENNSQNWGLVLGYSYPLSDQWSLAAESRGALYPDEEGNVFGMNFNLS